MTLYLVEVQHTGQPSPAHAVLEAGSPREAVLQCFTGGDIFEDASGLDEITVYPLLGPPTVYRPDVQLKEVQGD